MSSPDTPEVASTVRFPRHTTYAALKIVAVMRKTTVPQLLTDAVFPDGVPDTDDLEALGEAARALGETAAPSKRTESPKPTRRRRRTRTKVTTEE